MTNMSTTTDALGIPLFREDMLSTVWPEQKRHLPCIQDPPGIPLYTITGYITKGGVRLPVLRCAHGSTLLESFHLHLAKFITGKYTANVNGIHLLYMFFWFYLIYFVLFLALVLLFITT